MSNLTNDCEDGMLSDDKPESPVDDEPNERNYGGSSGGVVLKKGPWTSAEDAILIDYVKTHGEGNWNAVQKHSGLSRCGKSCRLRWANHLRPNLKKGSFTPQEELLIIELHAKMGNKWARMAAYLPGRTDNEIKNYWNTRIKRRQRAGLSIYPEDIRMKVLRERQNSDAINGGDKGPNDLLQSNGFVIPDVTFDGLKTNQNVMPYVPELPNISSSPYFSFMPPMMHRQKRLRESTALFSGFGGSIKNESLFDTSNNAPEHYNWSFPVDPDPTTFGPFPGSHTLSNGNYSASESLLGTVKLELPSLQYPEPELGNWGTSPSLEPPLDNVDAFIQSPPPTCSVESPRHSGLLDALVHEAKSKNSAKVHSSEKCSSSSTPGDIAESSTPNVSKTEWENYGDPLSPLGHSVTSFFSDASADIAGTFLNPVPKEHLWTSDVQKETPTRDPMFGSTRSEHDSNYDNFDKDAIAAFLDEEMVWHYKTIMPETSSSRQAWEFDSCTWNNMPGVCQMSEQP